MKGEIPAEMCGPKMLALRTDQQRRFAYLMGCGELTATDAAREAGYSDDGSSGIRVRTFELMHNPNVLVAIREVAGKVLDSLAPIAVRQARAVLDDRRHPHHGRMIETILNRTGFNERSTVEHVHTVDTKELEALARRLAAESGIDPARLLGGNSKIVDVTPTVIDDKSADT